MRVLVTGASGFVGSALLPVLLRDEAMSVRAALRRPVAGLPARAEQVIGELRPGADWSEPLTRVDAVIHLAARVHVMRDQATDPLAEFRRVNVQGTLELAQQAAAAGVRRFVFISSVKVNGEAGIYSEADAPAPADAYGISKHEAETLLRDLSGDTGMEVVIVRPPLVYGNGVRANFAALARLVARGLPLPLGAIHNRRSLVGVENLADFIATCLRHEAAANETFLVSDGEDLSTTELIRRMAKAMGRRAHLIPVPMSVLGSAAALVGARAAARRLLDTLAVDIGKARGVLAWRPPVSVDEGLARALAAYR